LSTLPLRILVTAGQEQITCRATGTIECRDAAGNVVSLEAGTWQVNAEQAVPAQQQFHLFTKTFETAQRATADAYVAEWEKRGYDARLVVMGKRFRTTTDVVLDNRIYWVSIARFGTESEAVVRQKALAQEEQWSWLRAETVEQGSAVLHVYGTGGTEVATLNAPLAVKGREPIEVLEVDSGFWKSNQQAHTYAGALTVGIGPDGKLQVVETVPFEEYLAGVVPAEMAPLWPQEALRAQAVAARSEVLATLGQRHELEGFDFCGSQHCRAYLGHGGRHPNSDAAVEATAGTVLVCNGLIVPTVYSANCGGWTANNDTVWSAPAQPALRAVPDVLPDSPYHGGIPQEGFSRWILTSPAAYCSMDKEYYRWQRTLSQAEVTRLVNQYEKVGQVRAIQLGDRGPGGRLKWIRVEGTGGVVTIRKELPIRRALGGLPSAMFIVEKTEQGGHTAFRFTGGGRGHGVGMCQQGARGMAGQGMEWDTILDHYFPAATRMKVQ